MFLPSKPNLSKPQKQSSWASTSSAIFVSSHFDRWPGVFAINAGYMPLRLVEYTYIWLNNAVSYPVSLVRFWVNLQAGIQVTRNPENVRMGKGKGSRKGMQARVCVGSFLFNVTSISSGLLRFFYNNLQVSVSFSLGTFGSIESCGQYGTPYTWVQQHMVQNKYVVNQLELYKGLLKKMHRPLILGYVLRIFWWRYVVPHAVWAPIKSSIAPLSLKQNYVRRRNLSIYVQPQNIGFIRQLKSKYIQYTRVRQKFSLPVWRRAQLKWARSFSNVRLFESTPLLPWDILLRAKRFKRILFYINFISFLPLMGGILDKVDDVWYPLSSQGGEVLPTKLSLLSYAHLRLASLVCFWRAIISSNINFSIFL